MAERAPFDVREFARTAHGSLRDDLDLAAFVTSPLAPDVVRAISALAALEGATMAHLRNVLVTPTHKDARVTAFLVTWAFEKFWIADALRAVVDANGGGPAAGVDAADVPGPAASVGRGPVRRALAGFVQGWPVVGAHMTIGLADDWMLRAAYDRLVEASRSRPLADAVDRIVAMKERHARFFNEEVQLRLTASPKAIRLARRELRRTPWPLGAAVLDVEERDAFTCFVFGGTEGNALLVAIERDIAALPGMDVRTAAMVCEKLAGRRAA